MSEERFPLHWSGRIAVVRTPPEVDLTIADELREVLLSALNRDPLALIVDMTATTFCDSAGINALVRAAQRAAAGGAAIRVAARATAVVRVFSLVGVDRVIEVYPSVSAAEESLAAPPGRARPGEPRPGEPRPDEHRSGCGGGPMIMESRTITPPGPDSTIT